MVTLSSEMIAEIQKVTETYLERERERVRLADRAEKLRADRLEATRIHDPSRYQAILDHKFLVKTYTSDMGCIEVDSFETSTEALAYVGQQCLRYGPDDDYSYQYYDRDGNYIPLEIDWVPQVRCA